MNLFIGISALAILVTILLTRSKVEHQDDENTSKL
jgi:hypothetical protein